MGDRYLVETAGSPCGVGSRCARVAGSDAEPDTQRPVEAVSWGIRYPRYRTYESRTVYRLQPGHRVIIRSISGTE